MKPKHRIALLLSVPLLAVPLLALSMQDEGTGMDEMVSKPTKHHAILERMAGTWTTTMDMPAYGVEGQKGTQTSRMLGGLWLIDDFEGQFMGAPFRGHAQTGYDSEKQRYVGTWIDSMSERLTVFEGSWDAETSTLRCDVPGRNPMTGQEHMEVHETEMVSDDEMVFRMKMPGPDGELVEVMTIRYERER